MLFAALLFPIGFAGWAVGHYTSLGKSSSVRTVTVGATTAATTSQSTSTVATTTGGSTTSSGGGDATAGKTVFASNGCGSCHTFKAAGSSGTIGPDLDTAPATDAKADHNMALAAFVSQSITDPEAYIAKGFSKGLMPKTFGKSLSKTQLKDLVAFILSGTKS